MKIVRRFRFPSPQHRLQQHQHHSFSPANQRYHTISIHQRNYCWTKRLLITSLSCCYSFCGSFFVPSNAFITNRHTSYAMISSIKSTTHSTTSGSGTSTSLNAALSSSSSSSTTNNNPNIKPYVIDSHLHVWGTIDDSTSQRYPYVQDPPATLQNCATVASLLQQMETANIDGALIVQPINYLYDHSYVLNAIQQYPSQLKGMLLFNPTEVDEDVAIQRLEELVLAGFVGVRFNPYLVPPPSSQKEEEETATTSQPKWGLMSEGTSLKVYQRCASLHIPVGIMCFQGLQYHYHDIVQLLQKSPETIMILDHFAFTKLHDHRDEDNNAGTGANSNNHSSVEETTFAQLLQLSQYPSVHVKISALFRMNDNHHNQYQRIYQERFLPLLQAFGSQRLLYGSDFPYILESELPIYETINPSKNHVYTNTCQLVASWCPNIESRNAIMGGNAERLFGVWGGRGT